MKLSPILCASFVALAGLALATDAAFAIDHCKVTDRAEACKSRGGFWILPSPNALPAASCVEPSGAGSVICPCGHCYYPNMVDCVLVNGTWHSAASSPPPFAYCTLPGGGIQKEDPAGGGGGDSSGGTGPDGIDCYRYGLVPNGIGGCRRPTVCDADPGFEGCSAQFRSQFFPFEARSLPDGLYELRMVADDSQDNPLAKAGKLVTPPTILVDNSPPTVVLQADPVQLCTLSARVSDKVSALKSAAYRIDAGVWLSILPQDGVMDDREESFSITLPQLKVGEHLLILRVEDGAENIGIGRLVIKRCSKNP